MTIGVMTLKSSPVENVRPIADIPKPAKSLFFLNP